MCHFELLYHIAILLTDKDTEVVYLKKTGAHYIRILAPHLTNEIVVKCADCFYLFRKYCQGDKAFCTLI